MLLLRKPFLTTAIAAVGAATLGAPAQAQSGEIVFVDLGRWTIYEATNAGYCDMRLRSGINGTFNVRRRIGSPIALSVQLNNARNFGGDVVFAFDDAQFVGARQGANTFVSGGSSAMEDAFRKAETLSILQGGATLASISLKSSSAGHRLLIQCADQWRSGFIPPRETRMAGGNPRTNTNALPPARTRPAPPASRPSTQPTRQAQRGPYPPNRAVSPRNISSWIRDEDYRRLPDLRGDGVLTFSLSVDEQGLVDECTVLKSSGSRSLDGRICRSLQRRAQFDPATDANGNAIEATYSSSVQFELPR